MLTCIVAVGLWLPAVSRAQANIAGLWTLLSNQDDYEEAYGPDLGAYMGVPLTAEGRAAALTYIGDKDEQLHRQCAPWLVSYRMLSGVRVMSIGSTAEAVSGDVVAWHISGNGIDLLPITAWIDGRAPPPPQALHTYSGYTTGKWEGNTLVATTTHIKDGLLDRNGLPTSNQQTIKFFIERDEEVLTITAIIRDPVYLDGPLAIAKSWQLDPTGSADASIAPMVCIPSETVTALSDGDHWINEAPWESSAASYMTKNYEIPLDAALGGVQTMYPEFRRHLATEYKPPAAYCKFGCCNASVVGNPANAVCRSNN